MANHLKEFKNKELKKNRVEFSKNQLKFIRWFIHPFQFFNAGINEYNKKGDLMLLILFLCVIGYWIYVSIEGYSHRLFVAKNVIYNIAKGVTGDKDIH